MNENRRQWLRSIILGTAGTLVGLAGCSHAFSRKGKPPMDTRNWQTHCFGRHLLTLPPDAKVVDQYFLDGQAIERLEGVKPGQIEYLMDMREQALRSQPHKPKQQAGGVLFIERLKLSGQGGLIYSWPSEVSRETNLQEVFLAAAATGTVSKVSRTISSDRRGHAVAWAEKVQQAFVGRETDVVPQQPGFCIKGGMLAGAMPVAAERYRLWVTFPGLPRVGLEVDSWQVRQPATDTLFSRMPAGFTALVNLASGTSVLRKREVRLDQQTAQEMLLRVSVDGKRAYHFQLEAVGMAESATQTRLIFELSTTNIRDEHGHVGDATFQSDEEAVAFWDAILQSFKVRPGAV